MQMDVLNTWSTLLGPGTHKDLVLATINHPLVMHIRDSVVSDQLYITVEDRLDGHQYTLWYTPLGTGEGLWLLEGTLPVQPLREPLTV
jgi:hypothetical protein